MTFKIAGFCLVTVAVLLFLVGRDNPAWLAPGSVIAGAGLWCLLIEAGIRYFG